MHVRHVCIARSTIRHKITKIKVTWIRWCFGTVEMKGCFYCCFFGPRDLIACVFWLAWIPIKISNILETVPPQDPPYLIFTAVQGMALPAYV